MVVVVMAAVVSVVLVVVSPCKDCGGIIYIVPKFKDIG